MKHLERVFKGNNFLPWYLVVLLLTLVTLSVIAIACFFLMDFFLISDKNIELLLLLIPFALTIPIFNFLVRKFHQRTVIEVINGRKKLRWNRIWNGFFVWLIIVVLSTIADLLLFPENYTLQFNLQKFIPLIIISLLFIPLQAALEEIVFRGYIMQGLGLLTGYRWIAVVISSLLFAFLHMENPEVGKYGQILFFNYLMMALIWGIMTMLDDGAEIAIGMHTANNLFISIFTTEKSAAFETDALFAVGESDPLAGLFMLTMAGILVILFFYKRYDWKFSILTKKIEKPKEETTGVG